MKLRNRKSYITSLPEGAPPTNVRPQITQIIYYTILLSVVGYVIYIFASRIFYYKEAGFVEVEKTVISASHAGKILKLPVKEGQAFRKKDLLAIIAASRNCGASINLQHNKLKYDLALDQSKLSLLKRSIDELKNRYNKATLQRALETGQARNTSNNKIQLEILKKQNEIDLLESRIILQQQQLKNTRTTKTGRNASADCFNENIYAPFDGVVYSVKRKLNEFTQRGEPLFTLVANNATVRVESYLNIDLLPNLAVGKPATVILTKNLNTPATIKAIHSSAYNLAERNWSHYKADDTHVLIYLQALNSDDARLWKRYDRMEVKVQGRK